MALVKPQLGTDVLKTDQDQTEEINKIIDVKIKRDTRYFSAENFKNGWGNMNGYDGIFELAISTKVLDIVTLEGLIIPNGSTNKWFATLPVGFRPRKEQIFGVWTSRGQMRIDVFPDGNIQIIGDDIPSFLSLSGITFLAQG